MYKNIVILFFLILTKYLSFSQSLPNKQDKSIKAPALVKIDGKTNEWNNLFQAYNHAVEIYYTIANDDHYLYFLASATNPEVINKLYASGLKLSISNIEKKKEQSELSVSFPVYEKNDQFHVNLRLAPKLVADSALVAKKVDSFVFATNRLLSAKAKWIEITGAKGLDSLISVYNEDGIKAASAFNQKMEYNVEFAIDLKYIKPLLNVDKKIKYHVISLGLGRHVPMDNVVFTKTTLPNGSVHVTTDVPIDVTFLHKMEISGATTDFWGEYTLAK